MLECEALLVATGRKPNVKNVGLEKAGIEFNAKDGVKVNDQLQTTNKVRHALVYRFRLSLSALLEEREAWFNSAWLG